MKNWAGTGKSRMVHIKKYLLILLLPMLLFTCRKTGESLKEGDIIFHESRSSQGEELKLATKSRYTHMGILFMQKGRYYVYEAVQPVRSTQLEIFIKRGKDGHYVIKRLKDRDRYLTARAIKKMKTIGKSFLGKNYDSYFQWSDKRIYCSELVWKIYKRALGLEIGALEKFSDFDLSHPKVKAMIKKRYGTSLPLDEPVISPVRMFNSDRLVTVKEKN